MKTEQLFAYCIFLIQLHLIQWELSKSDDPNNSLKKKCLYNQSRVLPIGVVGRDGLLSIEAVSGLSLLGQYTVKHPCYVNLNCKQNKRKSKIGAVSLQKTLILIHTTSLFSKTKPFWMQLNEKIGHWFISW